MNVKDTKTTKTKTKKKKEKRSKKNKSIFYTLKTNKLLFQYNMNSFTAHIMNIRGGDVS